MSLRKQANTIIICGYEKEGVVQNIIMQWIIWEVINEIQSLGKINQKLCPSFDAEFVALSLWLLSKPP